MPIYRFNEYYCGENYLDVQIYPEYLTKGKGKNKKGKYKITRNTQQALNDNNRDRYVHRLFNHNFTSRDYFITLTYKDKFLPKDFKAAEKEVNNYIRRIQRRAKKLGCPLPKIFKVTGYGERRKRLHSHLIVSGIFPPAVFKELWQIRVKVNGHTEYEYRGKIDVDTLEFDKFGIQNLSNYFMKHLNENKKRGLKCTYYRSKSMTEPIKNPRVKRLRAKQVIHMAEHTDFAAVENLYKPYILIKPEDYDNTEDAERALYYNLDYGGYFFLLRFYKPPKRNTRQRKREEPYNGFS